MSVLEGGQGQEIVGKMAGGEAIGGHRPDTVDPGKLFAPVSRRCLQQNDAHLLIQRPAIEFGAPFEAVQQSVVQVTNDDLAYLTTP